MLCSSILVKKSSMLCCLKTKSNVFCQDDLRQSNLSQGRIKLWLVMRLACDGQKLSTWSAIRSHLSEELP